MTTPTNYDARLAKLQRHDALGMYTRPGLVSGTSGEVTVTMEATNRVVGVRVARLDDSLRQPAVLADAVDRAHRAAILSKLTDRPGRQRATRPPTARAPRAQAWEPLDDILASGRPFDPNAHRSAPVGLERPLRTDRGESGNGCVVVELDLGSPRGATEIDRGWLARATEQQVSTALTEAFIDAYRKRDGS